MKPAWRSVPGSSLVPGACLQLRVRSSSPCSASWLALLLLPPSKADPGPGCLASAKANRPVLEHLLGSGSRSQMWSKGFLPPPPQPRSLPLLADARVLQGLFLVDSSARSCSDDFCCSGCWVQGGFVNYWLKPCSVIRSGRGEQLRVAAALSGGAGAAGTRIRWKKWNLVKNTHPLLVPESSGVP